MKILSIPQLVHDSSICILDDGIIKFYEMEERFSRVKHDLRFDCILERLIKNYSKEYFNIVIVSSHFIEDYTYSIKNIKEKLKNIKYGKLIFDKNKHHIYHSYSGFYNSGFDKAVCFSVDASGAILENGHIEIESIYYFSKKKRKRTL